MNYIDKDFLLKESESFCMIPWVHINTSPSGTAQPCCIARPGYAVGDTTTQSLAEVVNSSGMKQLRLDMLSERKNAMCSLCHEHEKQGIKSFRQSSNIEWDKYFDDAITKTNSDGSIDDFKMRYFDIRFSNICNFKCRTCNSDFSSQWEQEDKRINISYARDVPKNNRQSFVEEVVAHIPNLEIAYFAGGEPLITEEHYIMLEEMIRQGRTDIQLRYNTNLSNLKFKNKDLMALWKNFKNGIFIYASIDHYGKRAEYIRSGTDWGQVESNFRIAKSTPHIKMQINTVLSLYNYMTIHDFYNYLMDNDLYKASDLTYSLYNMVSPFELSAHTLPKDLKEQARPNIEALMTRMKLANHGPDHVYHLKNAIIWAESQDNWEKHRETFKAETLRLDTVRGESFVDTFPELARLMD
jgi:MoaA/NifB/PqqE/SkfB family radical SAM enzyme